MKLYIISLYLILLATCHAVKPDSCSITNKTGRQVTISGYNNDIGQCECQITLPTNPNNLDGYNIKITITHYPVGCNNSLVYWWDSSSKFISNQKNFTFTLELNGNLYVLIENHLNGSGELCSTFTVTTKSLDYYIDAKCENLNKNNETTTTTLTTSISTTIISTTTLSTTTTSSTTESTVVKKTLGNTSETKSHPSTMSTTDQRTTRPSQTKTNIDGDNIDGDDNIDGKKDSLLPIIMGCIIGILVIIVIILTCILLKRRNHQKTRNSENPNHGATNMAVYSSLDDNLKDSSQYGHIVRQHQSHPEQSDPVPGTSNEYINVTKEPLEGPSENTIEPNNNQNI